MNIIHALATLSPAILYTLLGYAIPLRYNDFVIRWTARVIFFLLIPFVGFNIAYEAHISTIIKFIVISFAISVIAAVLAGIFSIKSYKKSELAILTSYFNIGWFGIPISSLVFGNKGAAIMTAAYIGSSLFGATGGIYLMSSARYSPAHSLNKILKTPMLYAFISGSIIKKYANLPEYFITLYLATKNILFFLGMVIIGLSMKRYGRSIKALHKYGNLILIRQIICFTAVGIILILGLNLSIISIEEAKVLVLIAFLPTAANIFVLAETLETGNIHKLVGPIIATTLLAFVFIAILIIYITVS